MVRVGPAIAADLALLTMDLSLGVEVREVDLLLVALGLFSLVEYQEHMGSPVLSCETYDPVLNLFTPEARATP